MPRMFRHVFVFCCLNAILLAAAALAGAYTVQSGDTPQGIAKKHGITVEQLLKANKGMKPTKMQVGETLTIPGAAGGKTDKRHTEKDTSREKSARKAERTKEPTPAETKERDKGHKSQAAAKSSTHVVKKGETLGGIASKLGVSTADLLKANKGLDPRKMRVGQELTVPGAAKAEKAEPAPAEKSSRKAEKTAPPQEPTKTYTAHKRDTPSTVAKKFHISVKELARLNPDMGKKLRSGQHLSVPAGSTRASRAAAEEDLPTPEAEPEAKPTPSAKPAPTEVAAVAPTKPTRTPSAEPAVPTLPDSKESADAESYFEKGIEFGKQNKFPKAVENFDKAIKLNPNRADYFASRGHANYYLKQYAKAIDDYTKAIAKNPNFALAYSMRGLSRTRSGHYPQAIEDFNRAIALGPNEADFYKGRGFTYLHLKQPGPMCQDYKKACDLGDCELLESARKEKACP